MKETAIFRSSTQFKAHITSKPIKKFSRCPSLSGITHDNNGGTEPSIVKDISKLGEEICSLASIASKFVDKFLPQTKTQKSSSLVVD